MTDIATIGIKADTTDLKRARDEFGRFIKGGEAVERAVPPAFRRTEQKVSKSSKLMTKGMRSVQDSARKMAFAVIGAFGAQAVISGIATFDSSMSRAAAITRATDGDLRRLRDTAVQMGATTEFSAAQAADGLSFLGMAGFSAAESVAALPPVLDLATASGMGLAEAADTASNIMSAFGIEAAKAAGVTDILAAASTRANTNVAQLGQAISTAGPIAATLGIALEDTAAAIGVMSDAGIQGERAGTALRGVLAALAGPTTQAQQALAAYGLTAADVDPATRSLADIMQTLRDAGLSTADAMEIFGREAASGALVMIDAAPRLREFGAELRNVDGAAAQMASTMRDNLRGDLQGLSSAVSTLIIAMGDAGLTSVLRATVQGLTDLTRIIAGNVEPVFQGMIVTVSALAVTQLPALTASIYASVAAMGAGATAAGILTGAMRVLGAAVALAGGPWGILAGLIVAAAGYFLLFRDNSNEATKAMDESRAMSNELNAALGVFSQTAAPSAAEQAISLANANYELANSAYEAAKGELAKQRAMQEANRAKFGAARGEDGNFMDPYGALVGGAVESEDMRRINAALGNLAQAESRLNTVMNERRIATTAVTGAMSEQMTATEATTDAVARLSKVLKNATSGGAAKATDELTEAQKRALAIIGQMNEDAVTQSDVIGALDVMLKSSTITANEYAEAVRRVKEEFAGVNEGAFDLNQSLAGVFTDALMGVKSMSEGLQGLLKQMASMFLNQAFMNVLGNIFPSFGKINFGGARAMGGPVASGRTYLVGEQGPELFTPSGSGQIVPNNALGGGASGGGASGGGASGGGASGGGTVVQVINNSGTPARQERSRGPDGRELVRVIVGEELAGGGFDRQMGGRFGVTPERVRR
jgi:TP901 family phage tail tape measure protein